MNKKNKHNNEESESEWDNCKEQHNHDKANQIKNILT